MFSLYVCLFAFIFSVGTFFPIILGNNKRILINFQKFIFFLLSSMCELEPFVVAYGATTTAFIPELEVLLSIIVQICGNINIVLANGDVDIKTFANMEARWLAGQLGL